MDRRHHCRLQSGQPFGGVADGALFDMGDVCLRTQLHNLSAEPRTTYDIKKSPDVIGMTDGSANPFILGW